MKREKVYETRKKGNIANTIILLLTLGIIVTILRLFWNNDISLFVYCWVIVLLSLSTIIIVQNKIWSKQLKAIHSIKNKRRTNQIVMILHKIRDGNVKGAEQDYDNIMKGSKSLKLLFNEYEIGVIKGYYKTTIGDWQGLESGLERISK